MPDKIMNFVPKITMSFWSKYKTQLLYAAALAFLFFLLKLAEYRLLIVDHSMEIYAGAIALLFLLLGIWLAGKLIKPKKEISFVEVEKERIIEKEVYIHAGVAFVRNEKALKDSDISARELEVLQLVAKGHSNQEIAEALFVSVNTVKTHVTNLFVKLDATRRTQAVEKAKTLSIIP